MAVEKVSDLTIGNYLKIVSKGAVYNNLSEDAELWEFVKKVKKGDSEGRELRYLLRSAYGAAAAGFVPTSGGDYPTASQATINECTAQFKDFALTVEVERSLVAKALSDFSRYGEPLAEEMRCKTIALSRQLSIAAYGTGQGQLGTVSGTPTISGGDLVVNLKTGDTDVGFVGWFEVGDKIIISDDGTDYLTRGTDGQRDVDNSQGVTAYMVVQSKSRVNNQITCRAYTSAGARVVLVDNDNVADGDPIRRKNTIFDDAIPAGTDWNTVAECYAGIESLTEDDGRTVHGVALNAGVLGGTRFSCSGNPIDSQHFQQCMSQIMVAVGGGRYKYEKALMSWETLDSLVESREVDRRFQSIKDGDRGVDQLGYVHGKNAIKFAADEFCPSKRIYIIPSADVLQFHGSDFEYVSPNGSDKFHLKASSNGGYSRSIQAFMEGQGVLTCVHAPAIGVIHNFV